MLTIFSFILTILGSINWLLIGLLQYDFVAGIFGYQASIFSRLIYIIVGASSVVLVYKLFKGKGSINVFSRRNKKDLAKNVQKINNTKDENEQRVQTEYYDNQYAKVPIRNVESAHENISSEQLHDDYNQYKNPNSNNNFDAMNENGHESLFDEHLNNHR